MTKTEQLRLVAWRLRMLQYAAEGSRQVSQTCRHFGISRPTFYKWKKDRAGNLSRDVLERISYVLGIYKALQILFSDPRNADEWITRPNTAGPFGGRSALERMLSGNVGDLYVVRQYLDGERG